MFDNLNIDTYNLIINFLSLEDRVNFIMCSKTLYTKKKDYLRSLQQVMYRIFYFPKIQFWNEILQIDSCSELHIVGTNRKKIYIVLRKFDIQNFMNICRKYSVHNRECNYIVFVEYETFFYKEPKKSKFVIVEESESFYDGIYTTRKSEKRNLITQFNLKKLNK